MRRCAYGDRLCAPARPPRGRSRSRAPTPPAPPRCGAADPFAPDRRRLALGLAAGAAVALGGNLGGVSSGLLGAAPPAAVRALRLDALFPVRGLLRHPGDGFELLAPTSWLADQTLARRAAARVAPLDPPSLRDARARRGGGGGAGPAAPPEPVAAFGPAGSTGETNVSVVVQPVDRDAAGAPFRLPQLGPPRDVAQRLLDTVVAPPGSGRAAALVAATERPDGVSYLLEFEAAKPSAGWARHFLVVLMPDAAGTRLFTATFQVAARAWGALEGDLRRCADGFAVTA